MQDFTLTFQQLQNYHPPMAPGPNLLDLGPNPLQKPRTAHTPGSPNRQSKLPDTKLLKDINRLFNIQPLPYKSQQNTPPSHANIPINSQNYTIQEWSLQQP